MANSFDTFNKMYNFIGQHNYAVLKGVPGVGKSTFVYELGIKLCYDCCLVNCEIDYTFIDNCCRLAADDKEALMALIKERAEDDEVDEIEIDDDQKAVPVKKKSDDPSKEALIIFDNIDRCEEVVSILLDKLYKFNFKVILTYSAETEIVQRAKQKIAELIEQYDLDNKSEEEDDTEDEDREKLDPSDFMYELNPIGLEEFAEQFSDKNEMVCMTLKGLHTLEPISDLVFKNVQDFFEEFLVFGGLPGCYSQYDRGELKLDIVKAKQTNICQYYYSLNKIFERSGIDSSLKYQCFQIIESIVVQMLNSEDYMSYRLTNIRDGVSYAKYNKALDFLVKNNILIELECLGIEKRRSIYFFYDCGLLNAFLHQAAGIRKISNVEEKIKLLTIRNYAVQEARLVSKNLYYWQSKYTAYVDLVIEKDGKYFAFKVMKDKDMRNKVLHIFHKYYPNAGIFLLGNGDFKKMKKYNFIPYFAISGMIN